MTSPRGYAGTINHRCVTMAEVLKAAGYATCLSGKWHLAEEMRKPNDAWPTRRGFDRFFGTLTGCGSFFQPGTLTRGEINVEDEALRPDFFYTDAISAEAADVHPRPRRVRAGTAILSLRRVHGAALAAARARRKTSRSIAASSTRAGTCCASGGCSGCARMGILDDSAALSERDPTQPAWNDASSTRSGKRGGWKPTPRRSTGWTRAWAASSMRWRRPASSKTRCLIFLSDNGASDEALPLVKLERFKERSDILRVTTRDGREVRIGNEPSIVPGPEDTYASYGRAWANLSNTPFRYYKQWTHEGGIATPFIVHWPNGALRNGSVVRAPFQLVDVLPTILEATGAVVPCRDTTGASILPCEGRSLLPALRGETVPEATLYWEHTGNAAVRRGRWKLVRSHPEVKRYWVDSGDPAKRSRACVERRRPTRGSSTICLGPLGDSTTWPIAASRNRERSERASGRRGRTASASVPFETILDIYAERGQPYKDAIG